MTDHTVVMSRVRLARNISGYKFPSKINPTEASEVERIALSAAKEVFEPRFYHVRDLSASEAEYLVDCHLISPMLAESRDGAVILSKDKQLSVMLEEEDHVRSQCLRNGLALKECFDKVKEYDLALRSKARLSYDKQLGFLTACPTNVGTGMRASVMMFLPALSLCNEIGGLEEELRAAGLTIRGSFGEGSKGEGYCYQISNAVSLGVSEETILTRVQTAAMKIKTIENDLLDRYYEQNRLRVEDSVARAYAVLTSAKLLSQEELESLMIHVKIGALLGLLPEMYMNPDELVLMCKPSSLVRFTGCGNTPEERDAARASTVQKVITNKEI